MTLFQNINIANKNCERTQNAHSYININVTQNNQLLLKTICIEKHMHINIIYVLIFNYTVLSLFYRL